MARKYDYLSKLGLVKENTTREISLLQKNINTSVNLMLSNADKVIEIDIASFDYKDGDIIVERLNPNSPLEALQMVCKKMDTSYITNTSFLHTQTDGFNVFVGGHVKLFLEGIDSESNHQIRTAVSSGDFRRVWEVILMVNSSLNYNNTVACNVNPYYHAIHFFRDFPYMMNRNETIIYLNTLRLAGKISDTNVYVPLTDRCVVDSSNDYTNSYVMYDQYSFGEDGYYYWGTKGAKMGNSWYDPYENGITIFCQKNKNTPFNVELNLDLGTKDFRSSERIKILSKPYSSAYLVVTASDSSVQFRPVLGIEHEITEGSISLVLENGNATNIDLELLPYYFDNTPGRMITVSQSSTRNASYSSIPTIDEEDIVVNSLAAIYSSR